MEPTETERAALNERLARAMGRATYLQADGTTKWWNYTKGIWCDEPPDFTSDPVASRSLVEWLDADENRWLLFEQQLIDMFLETCNNGVWPRALARWMMTADPLLIAIAADAVIGGKDER